MKIQPPWGRWFQVLSVSEGRSLNCILITPLLLALAMASARAQGTVNFGNNNATRISTNAYVGGTATGLAGTGDGQFIYALYGSTAATDVNGSTAPILGAASVGYAFKDSRWVFLGYGTNVNGAGHLSGGTITPSAGLAASGTAQFVVIGWPVSTGQSITDVQNWFGSGSPKTTGWIGQSKVSGPISLATGGSAVSIFGTSANLIPGFVLGEVGASSDPDCGYIVFANPACSATKIFTNSAVSGPATGLTTTNGGLYYYGLYASATAVDVNGQTTSICGAASHNYAFEDSRWVLTAYGTNANCRGRLLSANMNSYGWTPVAGFAGGTNVHCVVIGWSAGIGTNIAAVTSWFGSGNPASDGWIGQSAVSGAIILGDGDTIATPDLFGLAAPQLQGFTLGLASPHPGTAYAVPIVPAVVLQAGMNVPNLQLQWPVAAGAFGVQSATNPCGPWTDTGLTNTIAGTNCVVTLPAGATNLFYRLVTQ